MYKSRLHILCDPDPNYVCGFIIFTTSEFDQILLVILGLNNVSKATDLYRTYMEHKLQI